MPKISKPQGRQVLPQSTDQPELSRVPSDGLGNLVSSISQTAQGATGQYVRFREEEAKAESQEALNSLREGLNQTLYDPTTGYLNKNGKEAYDSAGDVRAELDSLREQHGSQLSDMAQEQFNQKAEQMIISSNRDVSLQAAKGLEEWRSQEYETFKQGLISDAAQFSGKPEDLGRAMSQAQQEVVNWGESHGWSKEKTLSHADNLTSSVMSNAINGALARDDVDQAQELYENNKGNLVSQDYIQTTQAVNQALEREETKNQASRVVGSAQAIRDQTQSYSEALGMASQYAANPEETEKIKDQLDESFRRDQDARDYAAAQSKRKLSSVVAQDPEINTAELVEQYPQEWSNLTTDQKRSFKGELQYDEKLENYFEFSKLSPEETAKVEYSWISNNIPEDRRDEAEERLQKARRGQLPSQGAPTDVGGVSPDVANSVSGIINNLYGASEDRDREASLQADMAYRTADQMARRLSQDGQLTPEDTSKIVDSIAAQYKGDEEPTLGNLYNIGRKMGLTSPGVVDLESVSSDEQREAVGYLQRNNIPVSGEAVLAYSQEGPGSQTLQEAKQESLDQDAQQQLDSRQQEAANLLESAGVELTRDRVDFYVEDKMDQKMYEDISRWLRERNRSVTRSNVYSAYYQTFQ